MADDKKELDKELDKQDVNGSSAGAAPKTNDNVGVAPNDLQAERTKKLNEFIVANLEAKDKAADVALTPSISDPEKVGLSNTDGLHEGVSLNDQQPLFTYDAVEAPKKGSSVDLSGKFKTADPEKFPAKP